jgi:hypothetical protein
MAMPEAPLNLDDFAAARKDDVGAAWEILAMKAKTKAEGMKELPDSKFGLGVGFFDARHALGLSQRLGGM